ncbi:hypothetical protein IKF63_00185 [Candidatus Saccharibacteria bacterium]|nr:hypothetical protein [Candidatus Saccharibacteria bacterium]
MKGHFSHLFKPFTFVFISIFLVVFCVLSRTSTANATLTPSERSFFGANNIIFVDCNQSGGGMAASSALTSPIGTWKAQTYTDLTEDQLRGLVAVAYAENGNNITTVSTELSFFPNIFEYERKSTPRTANNLVNYVRTSSWFSTRAEYDNRSHTATEEELAAARSILIEGNRTLPPEINEHDGIGDIAYVELDGVQHEPKESKDNYVSQKSVIMQNSHISGAHKWTFFRWADPNGTTVGGNSSGGTGDPFGYLPGSTPSPASSTNPGNSSGGSSVNGSGTINTNTSGSVTNYKGDTILSADDIATITKNQPIYEEAVKNTNPAIPWQMLAAIHYRERHLSRTNPDNGYGVFQVGTDPNKYPKTDTDISDEEFLTQAKEAAMLLTNKYKGTNYTPGTDDGVKYGFFAYNGVAPSYISQALALDTNPKLTQEQAEVGEGSPYVMNRYDKERDPTDSETAASNTWCQIKTDGGTPVCPANNDFGAYVVYSALTGTEWQKTGGTTNTINPCQGANATASSSSGGCGGAGIAEFAEKVAWPEDQKSRGDSEVYPAFAEAARAVGIETAADANIDADNGGPASCDHFVAIVVKNTVDPEFPFGATDAQRDYLLNSPKWTEIPNLGNTSNLQPGDVFVVAQGDGGLEHGHIYIYLEPGKRAHASWNDHTGIIDSTAESYTKTKDGHTGTYHIFRSTSQENCNMEGGTTGSFDEGLKQIETEKNIKVGAAVSAPGNSNMTDVQIGGSLLSTKAGKTMSVPLAIAAKQKNVSTSSVTDPFGSKCSYSLGDAIKNAVAKDENCAAWSLWSALGGNDSAATTISDVLKAGKATDITVNSTKSGNTITPNTTDWGLVSQAIFAANMSSISDAPDILSAMKSHVSTNNNGLNSASFSSAMTAGGSSDGVTRQFGIVKLSNGKCSAISIAADGASKFSVLDDIVGKVLEQQNNLPSGTCPSGL